LSQRTNFRDCHSLHLLHDPLIELQKLVGLAKLKTKIFQLLFQRLQKSELTLPCFGHVLLYGPPGIGKTTLLSILAKIFAALGDIDSSKVVHGTASSLIAGFLGQTAPKTEEVIKSAFGGVLVIDEASSLSDGRSASSGDSFSKSCLDTLNRHLTENGHRFICVLAGYKAEIQQHILNVNPGLARRFVHVFEIEKYSSAELNQMALDKLQSRHLTLAPGVHFPNFLPTHFPHFGGDIVVLVDKVVDAHARAVFGKLEKKLVNQLAIDQGFATFLVDSAARNNNSHGISHTLQMYC